MENGPETMKRLRARRGLGQQQLATAVGAHLSSISQIERGVNVPRRDKAASIDEALGAGGEVLAAFGYGGRDELSSLRAVVEAQAQLVLLLAAEARGRLDDDDELVARLDALEQLVTRRQLP